MNKVSPTSISGNHGSVLIENQIATKTIPSKRDGIGPEALREMDFFSRFKSNYITDVKSIRIENNGNLIISMEAADMDLYKYVKVTTPAVLLQKLDSLIDCLLSSIAVMHIHGIQHRDIKLENILYFSESDYPFKLADFSMSVHYEGCEDKACNSKAYKPPELKERIPDFGADIYACGLVFHEYTRKIVKKVDPNKIRVINMMRSKDYRERPNTLACLQLLGINKKLNFRVRMLEPFAVDRIDTQTKNYHIDILVSMIGYLNPISKKIVLVRAFQMFLDFHNILCHKNLNQNISNAAEFIFQTCIACLIICDKYYNFSYYLDTENIVNISGNGLTMKVLKSLEREILNTVGYTIVRRKVTDFSEISFEKLVEDMKNGRIR